MQTTISAPHFHPVYERRTSVDFLVLWLAVTFLAAVALFAGWQFWHADRIFTGVHVAGVPIGGMTRARAHAHLSQELAPYPLPPVSLEYAGQRWVLNSAQVNPRPDLMGAVNQAFLVGRQGTLATRITTQWQALIGQADVDPAVYFDEGSIRHQISQIAAQVRRPGRAAVQIGTLSVPAQPGVDVDVDATARLVLAALLRREVATVPLQTLAVQPPAAETVATTSTQSSAPRPPLTLRDDETGLIFAADAATLKATMPTGDPNQINEEALRALVEGWAAQIDIPAQDARLRFNPGSGQVEVLQPSVTGRRLNVEETLAAIRQALGSDETQVRLPVEVVAPKVDSNKINEMGIRELVASGTTYFKGSSAARIHNIEVATAQFSGVVIPPGEIFSFNKNVEAVSAANGFEDSLIIWGDRTAVGVGGGVCQVSTTVFRAAFLGGFPLVERYNHGYVVSWYGEPGMDATIYTPSVDFKFRNDTDAYLLIQPVVDSTNGVLTFNFYGTKPDRQVTISDPVITDVKEPGEPIYRVDESLAPGARQQVEYAKNGLTATVERTITEPGKEPRVETLVSVYQPWNAVFLVGPGTEVPATPTPEPAAAPAATSAPAEAPQTP